MHIHIYIYIYTCQSCPHGISVCSDMMVDSSHGMSKLSHSNSSYAVSKLSAWYRIPFGDHPFSLKQYRED